MRPFAPLVLLAVLLSAGLAAGQNESYAQVTTELQPLTAAASTDAGQGRPITAVGSCRLKVCAPAGYTLTGGTMAADLYDYTDATWSSAPEMDETLANRGARCQPFPDMSIGVSSGKLRYRTVSATYVQTEDGGTGETDGGPAISVQLKCWPYKGGGRPAGVKVKAGYELDPTTTVCTTCPSAGSGNYKTPWNCAEFVAQNETLYECANSTCTDGGGIPYSPSSRGPRCWTQGATGGVDGGASGDKACWSTSGTGRICWTKIKDP